MPYTRLFVPLLCVNIFNCILMILYVTESNQIRQYVTAVFVSWISITGFPLMFYEEISNK